MARPRCDTPLVGFLKIDWQVVVGNTPESSLVTENTTRNLHMLTIGFEPETFVVPNSESTFESSTCKGMGLSKVGIHPLQKSRYGLMMASNWTHFLHTYWHGPYVIRQKPILNFFVTNKWIQLIPMRVNSTHESWLLLMDIIGHLLLHPCGLSLLLLLASCIYCCLPSCTTCWNEACNILETLCVSVFFFKRRNEGIKTCTR